MNELMRRAFTLTCAAGITVAVFAMTPATASPTSTKITVYQAPCASETCGSHDHVLSSGALGTGAIQIQAASSTTVGFDWIRLWAETPDGELVCLAKWTPSSTSFWAQVDWNSAQWPSCDGSRNAGHPTPNGPLTLYLDAHEKVGNGETMSTRFVLKLNNNGHAPSWSADPVARGTNDREPTVELRWAQNPEPDVVEYRFIRQNPDGSRSEFAVSATEPGGQGCDRNGTDYVCTDDFFSGDHFAGTYTYYLFVDRSSPSSASQCAIDPRVNCIGSPASDSVSVRLVEPATPSPVAQKNAPTTNPKAKPKAEHHTVVLGTTYYKDLGALPGFEGDTYSGSLPYQTTLPYAAPAHTAAPIVIPDATESNIQAAGAGLPAEPTGRQPWPALAGGLVLMMVGIHLTLLLRRPIY